MARPGRKRKPGPRHASGRLIQAYQPHDPIIIPETLTQRRKLVGSDCADPAAAGTPWNALHARGLLTIEHRDAAQAIESVYRRWASMAGVPPRAPRVPGGGGPGADPAADDWHKAKAAMERLEHALRRMGETPARAVDAIVLSMEWPERWFDENNMFRSARAASSLAALAYGLDVAAEEFGVQQRVAA